jgi:hypothetical protein
MKTVSSGRVISATRRPTSGMISKASPGYILRIACSGVEVRYGAKVATGATSSAASSAPPRASGGSAGHRPRARGSAWTREAAPAAARIATGAAACWK